MADESPRKGYVSAYLKQTPRTYAEAERDHRAQNSWIDTGEPQALSGQSNPGAPRPAANEK
jgi:hypothetical protein